MDGAADVLIAGGGVAGASLAVMLGRAGLRVELYEGRRFPREKPCGEGLMPAGVAVLRRLGLGDAAGGRPLRGVRYHGWGIDAGAEFPADRHGGGAPAFALGVRRLALDRALFEAARATPGVRAFEGTPVAGAVVEHGRAVGLLVGGSTRRAALVIGADGARSAVRRSLGLDAPPASRARTGVRRHFQLSRAVVSAGLQPDMIEIFVADDHELYVTPLPDDQILIAALADSDALGAGHQADGAGPHATFARWIDAQPLLRARLDGARALTPLGGRAPLASAARTGVAPGAVLLGDAAGFVDPITAGGMAQALATAELLAPFACAAVAAGGARGDAWLRRFDRRRRALLRDYLLLTRVMLSLVRRPALARTTLRLMRAAPRVMAHLIGVAGGVRRLLPSPSPGRPAPPPALPASPL